MVPATGEHTLRVENIGTAKQRVKLDGVAIESHGGQVAFSGPGGALLRLKNEHEMKTLCASERQGKWTLFVNELMVEEAGISGDGLRDLRTMGEGSYTIATSFPSTGIKRHACRKFTFVADGKTHNVVIAHKERIWQVALDGELVDQESQGLLESSRVVNFNVPTESALLPARIEIRWTIKDFTWSYRLYVAEVLVPANWIRARGKVRGVKPPVVSGSALDGSLPLAEGGHASETIELFSSEEENSDKENQIEEADLDPLPQGVSFDREAKVFQANIKDPITHRFACLGEFDTAEAAHQKYLEALPSYCPKKRLAPAAA